MLIAFIAVITNGLIAQNDRLYWIGANAALSIGELIRYGGEVEGGYNYDGKIGLLVGIDIIRVINNRFDFETGIDFSRNSFGYSCIDPMGQNINSTKLEHVDLLSIPLSVRIKLNKQWFVIGGIQYDQRINTTDSTPIDNQTGIGVNIKFGRDFAIADKIILYVAPEILLHDIIPFYPEKHQQRLTEFGLRISYKFGI